MFVTFILAILLLQLSLFSYKMYISRRRKARRDRYADDAVGNDVEDAVAVLWVKDEKVVIVLDGDEDD